MKVAAEHRRDGEFVHDHVLDPTRLAAVSGTGLLDTEADEAFDRLAALARQLLRAPFAFITVVDERRSFWKAALGLAEGAPRQNAVHESFCQYVVRSGEPLVLPDVRVDDRTRDNPSIQSMGVVAWAGFPVHTPDGHVLGTLCVVDTVVRQWTEDDVQVLSSLAAMATREVALRVSTATAVAAARTAEEATARAEHERARAQFLARIGELLVAGLDLDAVWQAVVHLAVPALGDYAFTYSVPGDGSITPQAILHRDPAAQPLLARLVRGRVRRVGEAHGPGLVAATGRTEVIEDLPSVPGLAPSQRGAVDGLDAVRSITVPLRARGELIAVLSVVRVAGSAPYGDEDVELVEAIAGRAALAIDNALAYSQERDLSLHLQQSLLPAVLPQPAGLQILSRYQPAARGQVVGGDWYDAYLDPSGSTALVIGDVAGHDINAAAAMGQLRTMLRMAGHEGVRGPADVLSTVDAATRALDISVFTTALLARIGRPDGHRHGCPRRVTWSSAGHPPPVFLSAAGHAELWERRPDRALGLDLDDLDTGGRTRNNHEAELSPGDTLLLYTDGLVERRDEDIDAGFRRLVRAVEELRDLPLDRFCNALLQRMTPNGSDDIALIAVRTTDDGPVIRR